MSRLHADDQYDFSDGYFADLRSSLGDKLHLCTVTAPDGRTASAGLFTACSGIVQYHLGGTGEEFLPLAPSKLMFDFMRRWGKEQGNRVLHLGGGVGAKQDSLFEFKAGFSDLKADFFTYRMVLDEERYEELLRLFRARGGAPGGDCTRFFPAYRQGISAAGTPDRGPVIVLGGGGHAKVAISALRSCGYSVTEVYDEDPAKAGRKVLDVPIKGDFSLVPDNEDIRAVVAIGDNHVRQKVALRFKRLKWLTVVHPKAHVDPSARLGEGTVVFAGAVVHPDAVIGCHTIVNTSASIDHDCVVGDFAHVAPGARLAGSVRLGDGVLMGVGSATIPGVSVGNWSVVGAGGVVVKDLPANVVAVGAPAKPRR
jgi:UDP-perosamine 4-acetyltransferase